jgi:hypothetical protein
MPCPRENQRGEAEQPVLAEAQPPERQQVEIEPTVDQLAGAAPAAQPLEQVGAADEAEGAVVGGRAGLAVIVDERVARAYRHVAQAGGQQFLGDGGMAAWRVREGLCAQKAAGVTWLICTLLTTPSALPAAFTRSPRWRAGWSASVQLFALL